MLTVPLRAMVLSSPSLRNRTKNPVNEQLLFHGTNRYCRLAEDSTRTRLCQSSKCYLCCVIRNSFEVKRCGTKNRFRRFGTGIYTTACSSSKLPQILFSVLPLIRFFDLEADDYTNNGDELSQLRVLLVSRVVVGNPYKLRENATSLTEPPCGHHSVRSWDLLFTIVIFNHYWQVVGEPGVDLNYEETVVYDNDAIRPAYLVVYGDMPESKSKFHALITTLFKTPLAS